MLQGDMFTKTFEFVEGDILEWNPGVYKVSGQNRTYYGPYSFGEEV